MVRTYGMTWIGCVLGISLDTLAALTRLSPSGRTVTGLQNSSKVLDDLCDRTPLDMIVRSGVLPAARSKQASYGDCQGA